MLPTGLTHCRADGVLGSPGPGRGLRTISFRGKVDELFEPNFVELRCQCWVEILSLRPRKGPGEMEVANRANLGTSHLYFRPRCFRLALVAWLPTGEQGRAGGTGGREVGAAGEAGGEAAPARLTPRRSLPPSPLPAPHHGGG